MTDGPGPRAVALAAALSLALAGSALGRSQEPGQQITPQFRGSVGRVLVDVTVVDDEGRFVPGLTAADFTVYEEGRPVDISFFAVERFRQDIPWAAEANLGEEVMEAPVLPRYLVVFVDGFNTPPDQWDRVKLQLKRYFQVGLQPNDRVLIATLTPERRLLVAPEFSRDALALSTMLDELRTNPNIVSRVQSNTSLLLELLYSDLVGGPPNDPSEDQGTEASAAVIRRTASLANAFAGQRKQEVLYTLNAMTSLARHLDRSFDVPGPKVMIMVSSGITQNPGSQYFHIVNGRLEQLQAQARNAGGTTNYDPIAFRSASAETIEQYLLRAVGNLNRLNYVLYTIGARGVQNVLTTDLEQQTRTNLSPGIQSVIAREVQDGLVTMADGTGGLAFDSSNNFAAAFERIDRDTAFRYVLGYNPPPREESVDDDYFFRIRVEVGMPGVRVRARRGYVD